MSDLEIRLSGTVEARRECGPVALPGRRVRALLVLLAVSAGRSVPTDTLARGIWDDEPPENARASLQTYVGRLRRALGADTVVTETSGYALALSRGAVDLLRFEDLVDAAAGQGDERAVLREALRIWRGTPFGDPPSEWIERQLVSSWLERYLQAYERRVDLDLAAGAHGACVPELRDLVERHPLRETLWARLLSALHAAGRTADALERYEVLRTRLADELGVDPSPELQDIYRRLLAAEPPAASVPQPSGPEVPRQLPAGIDGFTGRADRLAALDAAVDAGVRTIAVHGPGGVGKSSLAIHWARQSRDRFPDGELFVDLRGYGPGEPTGVLDALDLLLRGLGVPGGRIPADEDGRAALLRSTLLDKRMLLVLDNARAAGQVRPLLPGGDNVAVVTSRSQLRGLVAREGAHRVPVDPMPAGDAVQLLRSRVGDDASESAETLTELAELCGRLPVALAVAAERAGRDGHVRLEAVIERLRDEQDRITALTDWEDDPLTGVRAVFAWSYDVLDPETARMFRLLGLVPDSQVEVGAAAALAGSDSDSTDRLLDRLTEVHLLREVRPRWYEMHDLTRAYAAEVAERAGGDAEREAATQRLRSWYLHSARNAERAIRPPHVEPAVTAALPDVAPAEFATYDAAMVWFADHYRSVRAVFASAVADEDSMFVVALSCALSIYLRQVVATREEIDMLEVASGHAVQLGDAAAQGVCVHHLGLAYHHMGKSDVGLAHLGRARDLFDRADRPAGRLMAESNIGAVQGVLGNLNEAAESARRALADAAHPELRELRPVIENNLANTYLLMSRSEDALESARASVDHARGMPGRVTSLIAGLTTLGEAYTANADPEAAVETFEEVLELTRRGSIARDEVIALNHLGLAYRALGRTAEARQSWERAVELLEGIDTMQAYGVSVADLQTMIAELPADPQP